MTHTIQTHKFNFNLEAISLADLKSLYKHFQIEDFGNAEQATDYETFFKCFNDGELDGNKDALLFIRLTALMANNSAKLVDYPFVNSRGKDKFMTLLGLNKLYDIEFDTADYDHFTTENGGISIEQTILDYDVEAMIPVLSKYNFLELIQSDLNQIS